MSKNDFFAYVADGFPGCPSNVSRQRWAAMIAWLRKRKHERKVFFLSIVGDY